MFFNVSWPRFIATSRWKGIKKSVATFFRRFPEKDNNKKKVSNRSRNTCSYDYKSRGNRTKKKSFKQNQGVVGRRLAGTSMAFRLHQVRLLACRVPCWNTVIPVNKYIRIFGISDGAGTYFGAVLTFGGMIWRSEKLKLCVSLLTKNTNLQKCLLFLSSTIPTYSTEHNRRAQSPCSFLS